MTFNMIKARIAGIAMAISNDNLDADDLKLINAELDYLISLITEPAYPIF